MLESQGIRQLMKGKKDTAGYRGKKGAQTEKSIVKGNQIKGCTVRDREAVR